MPTYTTNPNAPAESTILGVRVIALFISGSASRAQLDAAYYTKNWISTADFEAAITPAG